MATKKKVHSKPKMTIPLAVVAGFLPGISDAFFAHRKFNDGSGDSVVDVLVGDYTGIQTAGARAKYAQGKSWSTWRLGYGLYPLLGGLALHTLASKLGINRLLARARIPYVRI